MAGRVAVLRIVISRPLQFPTIVPAAAAPAAETQAQCSNGSVDLRRAPSPIPSAQLGVPRGGGRGQIGVGPLVQFAKSCHVTGESAGPI